MNLKSLDMPDTKRLQNLGSFLIGAGVYAGLFGMEVFLGGFIAGLPTGAGIFVIFVLLAMPVVVYLHITGKDPASFLPRAVMGALSIFFILFFIQTLDQGEGGFLWWLPFVFVLLILLAGSLPHWIAEHYDVTRNPSI